MVYAGFGISAAWYRHWINRAIEQIRGALVAVIFGKVLQLSGDHQNRAVTLVSGEAEKLIAGLECAHELWANVFQASVAFRLLKQLLGSLFLVPFAVATCMFDPSSLTPSILHADHFQVAGLASA